MTPKQKYNALLAKKVIVEFGKRNIEGFYFGTKEEALAKTLEMIPEESVVSWGGSETLKEIGLIDSLKNGKYIVLDPNAAVGGQEKNKIAHLALNSDYYFMSSNAISITGELVNMDGIGNRVAALIYSPKNVIVIAGINKIEQNLELAIQRVKTLSSPIIVLGYKQTEIPTFEELLKLADEIGSQLVITERSIFKGRIQVILVGESLGY
jgi:hypothetical protein